MKDWVGGSLYIMDVTCSNASDLEANDGPIVAKYKSLNDEYTLI